MIFSGYFTLFYIIFMLMLVCIISYYFYVVEWNLSDIIPCYLFHATSCYLMLCMPSHVILCHLILVHVRPFMVFFGISY